MQIFAVEIGDPFACPVQRAWQDFEVPSKSDQPWDERYGAILCSASSSQTYVLITRHTKGDEPDTLRFKLFSFDRATRVRTLWPMQEMLAGGQFDSNERPAPLFEVAAEIEDKGCAFRSTRLTHEDGNFQVRFEGASRDCPGEKMRFDLKTKKVLELPKGWKLPSQPMPVKASP